MRKNVVVYTISFVLLLVVLFSFNKTYLSLTAYSGLTNRHNSLYNSFQSLSGQLDNAAVINPDLIVADSLEHSQKLFFADSLFIVRQLGFLLSNADDSTNSHIIQILDPLVKSELSWLFKSNVPDSIIQHKATNHIILFQRMDSLIQAGIQQTIFLINGEKKQLNNKISRVRLWMTMFAILSGMLLVYTTFQLLREQTNRKRKEKELETVFNRINDAVVSVDNNWRYTFLNDAALATHPGNRKKTLGKVIWDIHPEMKGTAFWDKYHEAMQTRKVVEIENHYAPMNTWFSVKVYPSDDGLTIFYKDVTEQRKFQEYQALFAAIVNSSDDAIISKNLDGIIMTWNFGAEKIFGYTGDEILGRHISLLIPPELQDEEKRIMEIIRKGTGIDHYETKRIRKDGAFIDVSLTISPVKDSLGKIIGASKISRDITERKRVEETLQKTLKEVADYKYALNEASIVAITDQKGTIKYVNDNFCKISKFKPEELIGKDHRIINSGFHPKDFIRDLWVTIANGKIWKGELKNKAKDGTVYWVDTTIVPFLDDHGKPYQYVAIRADITERKKAEDNLAASERHFRSLIENSAEGIALSDEFSNTLYRSPGAIKITGILPRENTISLAHPEDLPLIKATREEVLKSPGMPVSFQARFRHARGHYFWMEGTFTNLLQVDGINAIVTNFRDITQRKEAEEKLIKSEKIYKTIASSIPGSVICLLDTEYRYLLIEGDMLEMLGYSKSKLLGNKAQDVLPPAVFSGIQDDFDKVLKGETITRESTRERFDFISRFIPLKDKNDNVYAILTAAFDVTALKNAQRDIAELNRSLEEKIATRTDQLRQINNELENFTYSVSHDLRAPLRIIDGFSQILKEDYAQNLDAEGNETINIIMRSAQKMGRLIDDLLNFSKLGRTEMRITNVNMEELVEEVLEELKAGGVSIPAQFKLNQLKPAQGDSNLLKQVWINLISNAIKYSAKKEKPAIEIGMTESKGQPAYFIKDNGAGFDMQFADKLFGVFQRLHKEEEFTGTGVGLALVQRIITRHGGTIWADAKENKGATFYFTLTEE